MRMNGAIKQGLGGDRHSTLWLSTRLKDKRYALKNSVMPHRVGSLRPSVTDTGPSRTEAREEGETH